MLLLQGDEPPAEADSETASTEVPPDLAFELAQAFRPRLLFDSSERWPPLVLRRFFSERPRHRLCTRTGGCERIAGLEAFAEKVSDSGAFGDESYLDVAGDERPSQFRSPTLAECAAEPPLMDCDIGPSTAMYYRASWANNRYYVDYWWFLRFNDNTPDSYDHESDWEGVTAVTAPGSKDTLDYVSFASHEGRFRYAAGELERGPDGRPFVYVANGSHAAYAHKCDRPHFLCQQLVRYKRLAQVPERRFDGARPWGRNEDADCISEATPEDNCLRELPRVDLGQPLRSWTIWGGLWGASCGKRCDRSGTDSPRSPGRQDRYGSPWCSVSARGRQCDTTPLGCDAWLGRWCRSRSACRQPAPRAWRHPRPRWSRWTASAAPTAPRPVSCRSSAAR